MTTAASRIAIACQGGGSHTAFTAGVLGRLLKHYDRRARRLEGQPGHILGLSGTSGGAMCAILAWYALLTQDSGGATASRLLDDFWAGNAATTWLDAVLNAALVQANRLEGAVSVPELSPYTFDTFRGLAPPPLGDLLDGAGRLRKLLEQHIDFHRLPLLVQAHPLPRLLIAAVDVLSGEFKVFRSDAQPFEVTPDALLASAALPTLFPAVEIDGHFFWDGLFSQNPPIHDFLSTSLTRDEKPDEIWIVQINPEAVQAVPRTNAEILDRRNELGGNLSLNQEVHFIERVNALMRRLQLECGVQLHPDFKEVRIARITLSDGLARRLDAASKLDRDPRLIAELKTDGERQAAAFLRRRAVGSVEWEF
jgi:NTE family protein